MPRRNRGIDVDDEHTKPDDSELTSIETSRRTKKGRLVKDHYGKVFRLGQDAIEITDTIAPIDDSPQDFDWPDGGEKVNYYGMDEPYQTYQHDMANLPDRSSGRPKQEQKRIVDAWLDSRTVYLQQIMAREGLSSTICEACGGKSAEKEIYRCQDCHGSPLTCKECCVDRHKHDPLHRVQHWNKGFWRRHTLKKLGLVVHLGHGGKKCPSAVPAGNEINLFHLNGHHPLSITYCTCKRLSISSERRYQLLYHGWFPASQTDPQTVFTLDTLKFYNKLASQGRASGQDFYDAMVLFTDATGLAKTPKRYDEFLAVARCYAHLQMLKRAGRGNDITGADGTSPGGLALECTRCPQPGKNLPADYARLPPEKDGFKNNLHLAKDCCFKAKGKDPNNRGKGRIGVNDKSLQPGGSYFVPEDAYADEISKPEHATKASEICTCDANHRAFNQSESKYNKGYSVTGIAGIVCSRHGLVRPKAIGDLQKGERYVNMDYVFLSTLACSLIAWVVASYDIACQWGINFASRNATFPPGLRLDLTELVLRLAIPKLHIMVHGLKCQGPYSLNFMRGVGRTDGEEVERLWSATGPFTPPTKEMTPGHRKDSLNNLWGHLNWSKISRAGKLLLTKFESAVLNCEVQRDSFEKFTSSFPPAEVAVWEQTFEAWYLDPHNVECPFFNPTKTSVFTKRRDELIEAEDKRLASIEAASDTRVISIRMNMAEFVSLGLELEQAIFKHQTAESEAIKSHGSITADLSKKRKALHSRVAKWQAIQPQFMPRLALHLLTESTSATEGVDIDEDGEEEEEREEENSQVADPLKLWFPSSLSSDARTNICSVELLQMEVEFRIAQADAALDEVRMWLRHQKIGFVFKRKNLSGQRAATRAYSKIQKVAKNIRKGARTYRVAREALLRLGVPVEDSSSEYHRFKALKEADLQSPSLEKESAKKMSEAREMMGEGGVTHSWLWDEVRGKGGLDENGRVGADLRVEWCRSKARLERWEEELVIVEEEMRRCLVYHEWKANDWRQKAIVNGGYSSLVNSGIAAYAAKQAYIWDAVGKRFQKAWAGCQLQHTSRTEWPTFLEDPDMEL